MHYAVFWFQTSTKENCIQYSSEYEYRYTVDVQHSFTRAHD